MGSSWCRQLLFGSFLPQLTAPGESLKATAGLAVTLVMYVAFRQFRNQYHYAIGTTCILSLSPPLARRQISKSSMLTWARLEILVECARKGCTDTCNREEQGKWESWATSSHGSFVGATRTPRTTLKGTQLLRMFLGHQPRKTETNLQTTTGLLWGSQRKISYSSSWKTYMPWRSDLLWFLSSCL